MGLIGNFEHKLDAKGRLVIPACFREELGSRFVATTTDHKCIKLYSECNWENDFLPRLHEFSIQEEDGDEIQRFILANSYKQEIDSMGRTLIPEKLRLAVGITGEVCINGNNKKLEIWDSARWKELMRDSEKKHISNINKLIPGL